MRVRNRRSYVVNPAVSEAQRRYLNSQFGHDWVKEHGFDNKGELPDSVEKPEPKIGKKKLSKRAKRKMAANAAKQRRASPLKLDPTRTITLRRFFATLIRQQFARLKGAIVELVVDEDVFGLKEPSHTLNVFCSTGEGGGTDPSCSPDGTVSVRDALSKVAALPRASAAEAKSLEDRKGPRGPYLQSPIPADLNLETRQRVLDVMDTGSRKEGLVPIASLIAMQSVVSKKSLQFMVKNLNEKGPAYLQEKVTVVQLDGKNYLFDGTHRTVASKLLGKESLKAVIYKPKGRGTRNGVTINLSIAKVANSFCPTGEGGGVDPSCSPEGSKALLKFVSEWTSGTGEVSKKGANVFEVIKPSDEIVKETSSARPKQAVILFRSHRVGAKHEDYESWTPHREMAEMMMEGDSEREVLVRRFDPSEILFSSDHLPLNISEEHAVAGEVVVATGKATKKMADLRGEKVQRGQSGQGDPIAQWVKAGALSANAFCPTGVGGGVDASCSPADRTETGETHTELHDRATNVIHQLTAEIKAKVGKGLTDFIDGVPGGKALREKLLGLKTGMENRYGKTTARNIVAVANAISWGAFTVGPLIGHPNYIPASGLMAVGAVLAEGYLQASRGVRALTGNEYLLLVNLEELDEAGVQREGQKLYDELVSEYRLVANSNPDGCNQYKSCGTGSVEKLPMSQVGYDSVRSKVEIQFDVAHGVKSKTTGPILVDENDKVIDGAHRLEEARARGDTHIEAKRISRSEHERLGDAGAGIRPRDEGSIRHGKEFDDWMDKHYYLTNAAAWVGHPDPKKIEAFQEWLKGQIKQHLTSKQAEALWTEYAEKGFRKGAGRSFDDVNRAKRSQADPSNQSKLDFYNGSREQFLKDSFSRPVAVEKIQLLAGRSFDEMENVTLDMSNKMSRALTDGLVEGKGVKDIAKDLTEQADLAEGRAMMVARTEIVRVHAEGQLTALEAMGVEEVGVAVEWTTSGIYSVDKKGNPISPCEKCLPMEGVVLTVAEARGMIPRHPN